MRRSGQAVISERQTANSRLTSGVVWFWEELLFFYP